MPACSTVAMSKHLMQPDPDAPATDLLSALWLLVLVLAVPLTLYVASHA